MLGSSTGSGTGASTSGSTDSSADSAGGGVSSSEGPLGSSGSADPPTGIELSQAVIGASLGADSGSCSATSSSTCSSGGVSVASIASMPSTANDSAFRLSAREWRVISELPRPSWPTRAKAASVSVISSLGTGFRR